MSVVGPATRDAKRKLPAERRGELLARAVEIGAVEGLSAVTLRRVAADLKVTPGLVSHYFSSADQLIAEAFHLAAIADIDAARSRIAGAATPAQAMDALMDHVLDDSSEDASALWLDAWSMGRRNPELAAKANALTGEWLACLGAIVHAGCEAGQFHVEDVDVAARRLLTMIDGLGTQTVIRAIAPAEIKHIARSYVASELGIKGGPRPSG